MSNLYELSGKYARMLFELEDNQGEVTQEFYDEFMATDDAIEEKVENCAKALRNLEGEKIAIANEVKRLSDKKKRYENKIQSLKTYVQGQMEFVGKDSVKGEVLSVRIQNNPPSLEIEEDAKIPEEYLVEQEPKIDRKSLLKMMKESDEYIEGVSIKQTRSLRIF